MQEAAEVRCAFVAARCDRVDVSRGERGRGTVAELCRHLRLQERVQAGGATADVGVGIGLDQLQLRDLAEHRARLIVHTLGVFELT